MQSALTNPAASDRSGDLHAGTVVVPASSAPTERRHYVFGLFEGHAKAEEALDRLRTAQFEDGHLLLAGGMAGARDGDGVGVIGGPFGSLTNLFAGPVPLSAVDGLAPRIAHHIRSFLERGGAVLIVVIQTAEQERVAARTLLTCKCDLLLTHEVAVRP